ncbi:hypothetical protein [Bradyrhizobium sp. AZCC 2289]|uniref:hypothetical protein n=1 Tax=Bradyrhizobium sp. AZCC 2289 TaxID=3117026 RepID=UPI002FEED8E9
MAGCSDNERFNFKLFGKFDDASHRMPDDDMCIEFDITVLGHRASAQQNLAEAEDHCSATWY